MRLTIVPSDKKVNKDGISYIDIDLSWIPVYEGKQIHAVQWFDEDDDGVGEGEIEFVGPHQNLPITTLGIENFCSFERAIHQWNEKRDEEEAFHQEYLAQQERLRIEEEERIRAEFLDFESNIQPNQKFLPDLEDGDEGDDGEEENIFYDIEELLKEI